MIQSSGDRWESGANSSPAYLRTLRDIMGERVVVVIHVVSIVPRTSRKQTRFTAVFFFSFAVEIIAMAEPSSLRVQFRSIGFISVILLKKKKKKYSKHRISFFNYNNKIFLNVSRARLIRTIFRFDSNVYFRIYF